MCGFPSGRSKTYGAVGVGGPGGGGSSRIELMSTTAANTAATAINKMIRLVVRTVSSLQYPVDYTINACQLLTSQRQPIVSETNCSLGRTIL
jgi:hypothetical protein